MKNTIRLTLILVLGAALAAYMAVGCGSSSSTTASDPGTAVTLTGAVQSASVSSNIAAPEKGLDKGLSKDVSNVATQCTSVKVYQLTTGTLVGEGVCNADGTFSITMYTDYMQGEATDEVGASFVFRGVIVADNLLGYVEATYSDGVTTIAADTVDPEALTSVMDMLAALGISDITDLPAALAGIDPTKLSTFAPKCFFKLQDAMLAGADQNAVSPMSMQMDKLKNICNASMELIALPAAYANWGLFMKACMHGDLSSDLVTQVGAAATAAGLSGDDWASHYSTYADTMDAAYSALSGNLAGGAGLEALSDGDTPFCQSDVNDSNAVTNLANTFLNAGSATQFTQTFGNSSGMKVMLSTIGQYKDSGSWDQYDPDAIVGVYQNCNGDFSNFFSGSTLNTTNVQTIYNYINAAKPKDSTMTSQEKLTFFATFINAVQQQGFDTFAGNQDAYIPLWMSQQSGGRFTFTAMESETMTACKTCNENCRLTEGKLPDQCGLQCASSCSATPAAETLLGSFATTGSTCAGLQPSMVFSGTPPNYLTGPGGVSFQWTSGATCSNGMSGSIAATACTVANASGALGATGTVVTLAIGAPANCSIVLTKGLAPLEPTLAATYATAGSTCGVDILPATMTLTKSGTTYSNGNGSITITWESGTTCTVGLFPFGTPASCAVNRDDVTKPRITIVTTDPPGPPPSCTLALAVQ